MPGTSAIVSWAIRGGLLAAAVLALLPAAAGAHNAYRYGFASEFSQPAYYYFENEFPGNDGGASSYKDAFIRAAATWNALGKSVRFQNEGYEEVSYSPRFRQINGGGQDAAALAREYCQLVRDGSRTRAKDGKRYGLVFWEPIPQSQPGRDTGAQANFCKSSAGISKFMIAFNSRLKYRSWYRGASRSVPRDSDPIDGPRAKLDFQGSAFHEIIHGTGWEGHLASKKTPYNGTNGAKCGRYDANRNTMCPTNTAGTPWSRTLAKHDRHTINKRYP